MTVFRVNPSFSQVFKTYLSLVDEFLDDYRLEVSDEVRDVAVGGFQGFEAVNRLVLDTVKRECVCGRWRNLHLGSLVIVYAGDTRIYAGSVYEECRAGLIHTLITLHSAASGQNLVAVAKYYEDFVHVFAEGLEKASKTISELREKGVQTFLMPFEVDRAGELDKWFGFMRREKTLEDRLSKELQAMRQR